jgi:rubredoxin
MRVDLELTYKWTCPVCQQVHYHDGSIVREQASEVLPGDYLPTEGEWMCLPVAVTCPACLIEFDTDVDRWDDRDDQDG